MVFSARMIDRVGKGIRGAPRDALVADVTPPEIRGAAYGLRRGAGYRRRLSRPAAGGAADVYLGQRFSRYFLGGGHSRRALHSPARIRPTGAKIRHRAQTQQSAEARKPEKLSAAYWWVVAIGSIFTLARFSEAFLVLRAQQMEIRSIPSRW